jgi:glycosyltransferase involved in cell wall biosynthesis
MDYSIVVPVYNSAETLAILMQELNAVMSKLKVDFEIIFVDDCSNDKSWQVLKDIKSLNNHVKIIRLANNVGQWMATLAGIKKTKGNFIITIDDDLEYETNDIELLIKTYNESDVYLVYGIPIEKKNKNLSYKLFFKIRDRFLRIFFDKIQTESFKIFKREIYFDKDGKMYSHLHFEAYTKFTVAKKYIAHVDVNYRSRYFGNSNHTLFMKVMLMVKYGIEYYKSPFKYPLYLLFILVTFYFAASYFKYDNFIFILVVKYIILMIVLLIVGILGKYLSSLYFKLKGLPEYIIIEEF